MKYKTGILMMVWALSVGCARKSADPTPAADPGEVAAQADVSDPAAKVQFQILQSDEGSLTLPGNEAPSGVPTPDEIVYSGTQVFFARPLPYPRTADRDFFIVWNADSFSQPLTSADYQCDNTDTKDANSVVSPRTQASYDPVTRRYFIAFSEIFRGRSGAISPADEQILHLNFVFQDGKTTSLDLKFRVNGVPPKADLIAGAVPTLAPADASLSASSGQLAVSSQTVENPANRPLKLWVKVKQLQIPTYESFVTMNRVRSGPVSISGLDPRVIQIVAPMCTDSQPDSPFPTSETHKASAPLASQLSVVASDNPAPALNPISSDGTWTSTILPAGGSVELKILDEPADSSSGTLVASPQTVNRGWDSILWQSAPQGLTITMPGYPMDRGHPHHAADFQETYTFGGAHVTGQYETYTLFSEIDELQPPLELPAVRSTTQVDIIYGDPVPASAIPTWNSVIHL